ncbi:MAG: type II toxin-antitoxin system PemK/MazF family toxin [Planctomycetota bacterium]
MKRGEVWWADSPKPAGRHPVVLLSRDEAYAVRELITVAPVTTRVRKLPVEVPLGRREGLPKACVANLDSITTLSKQRLAQRTGQLPAVKMRAVDAAIRFALGLE